MKIPLELYNDDFDRFIKDYIGVGDILRGKTTPTNIDNHRKGPKPIHKTIQNKSQTNGGFQSSISRWITHQLGSYRDSPQLR